jgi:hypothetical protein
MMTKQRCLILLTYLVVLSGGVLGGVLVSGLLGEQRQGENEMNGNHITVDHVRRMTDKPFGDVTTAFERQLGHFEPGVYQALATGGDAEGARARIEAMAGFSCYSPRTTTGRCFASPANSARRSSTSWATRCSPSR